MTLGLAVTGSSRRRGNPYARPIRRWAGESFPRRASGYARERMPGLFEKRLLFVMGKGGVGRTTIAAALGLLAAAGGRRVIVAELAGQNRVARMFGEHGKVFA